MIIGNLIMFAYVGALGALGTKKGMNFALIASIVFGRKGYVFSSGLLSTLLLGWYAVQTGITGNLISSTYHLNYVLMTVIAGVLYIGITFVGVKGLHYIGLVSVPLFVVLGVWVAGDAVAHHGWGAVMSYAGADGKGAMSMGVGLTIVLTLFVDAGTVTADFNRWAKDLKGSLVSTFSAFPFANLVAMLVGGIMTAALATPNANPFGADNMFGYMNDKQMVWLSVIAFIFLYCNLGSVCSHCLYNAHPGKPYADPRGRARDHRHRRRRRQCLGFLHRVADAARHSGAADRRDHSGRPVPDASELGSDQRMARSAVHRLGGRLDRRLLCQRIRRGIFDGHFGIRCGRRRLRRVAKRGGTENAVRLVEVGESRKTAVGGQVAAAAEDPGRPKRSGNPEWWARSPIRRGTDALAGI